MYTPIQINPQVPKRRSKWVIACSSCQCEKFVSYSQIWNIKNGKCGSLCVKCAPKNTSGLARGRKWHPHAGSNSKKMRYIHFFVRGFVTQAGKDKQRLAKLGKTGNKANAWKSIKKPSRLIECSRQAYKDLRTLVFTRDQFSCVICTRKGGKLEMDHIKEWCNYPELRYEASNCRTLCKDCHTKTDNYGHKARKVKKC